MDRQGAQQLVCAFASTGARSPGCHRSALDWGEGAQFVERVSGHVKHQSLPGNFSKKARVLGRGADRMMEVGDSKEQGVSKAAAC